jgi:HD superfamily phosphohydrolase
MLARYFMYQQVYFHPVRRIYDIHLKEFLKEWLPHGRFATTIGDHLKITDSEVTAAIRAAALRRGEPGHDPASRIVNRRHFKLIYERNPSDLDKTLEPGRAVYEAALAKYGQEKVRYDPYHKGGGSYDLPIKMSDGRIVSSMNISDTLNRVLPFAFEFVFIDRDVYEDAVTWLAKEREAILAAAGGEL